MSTTREILEAGIVRLRDAGSETPRLDAELLLAHANHVDRTSILAHPDAPVGTGPAAAYDGYLERRATGEPVAYIRGIKEFHGLAFAVDPRALIPRPETEALVELALGDVMRRLAGGRGAPVQVVDVGTGSGAIAIALAAALRSRRVPPDDVSIVATDISPEALDLARDNAVGHAVGDRVRFVGGDLLPPGTTAWDIVIANLPYVRSGAMAGLPVATSFEPALALDGGPDGLAVITRLVERLPAALARDGVAMLEIGADQEAAMLAVLADRAAGRPGLAPRCTSSRPRVAVVRAS
jgi:release factor glutamine methyltransferase